MVDPHNITDFERTDTELQEFLMFCPAVAGKTAVVISKKLDEFLFMSARYWATSNEDEPAPFELLKRLRDGDAIESMIKNVGLGKNTLLTRAYTEMANRYERGFDLRTCSASELEEIPGIGFKTSRFFLLHSRPQQEIAVIDTHILHYLRDKGYDVPRNTPASASKYAELEKLVLKLAKRAKKSVADFDLWVWRKYTKTKPISA
jgi:hypothetical protein